MSGDELQSLIRGEREFLHDIANQLVVIQGMGAIVLKKLSQEEGLDAKVLERLEKVVKAADSMATKMKDRRKYLIELVREE
jgi:gamma-glutamylcysteine synthetase